MKKTRYVDPMIGTVGDEKQTSIHGGGKTHPGACYPFGMVQLSPDTVTGRDNGTGYNYCQNTIEGFSFNHLSGVGWYGDLGNLQIMPIVGECAMRSGSNSYIPFRSGGKGWRSPFDHRRENARAGYYSVFLERYGILAEATASCYAGQLRFTYPQSTESGMIFNFSRRIAGRASEQEIWIDGNSVFGSIVCRHEHGGFGRGQGGVDYTLHFCLLLSKTPKSVRFFEHEHFLEEDLAHVRGEDLHLLARFDTEENEPILVHCGISYVDIDGAYENLNAECSAFDFDGMARRTDEAWENALSRVTVEGGDDTERTVFYTCLYHTMLDPRTAMDVNGRFSAPNGETRRAAYCHRTVFSGWDVYRSEFPLLTLIAPQIVSDTVNSLAEIAAARGIALPRWELMGMETGCMVGESGTLVMADAYLKGIRDFDIEGAYRIARASAMSEDTLDGKPFRGLRPASDAYRKDAFVPGDLSSTLELLLADHVMARLAEALGNEADQAYFLARAARYRENYDPETGFMGPRDENGGFLPTSGRYDTNGCAESNLYQQSMFVPYDVEGLAALFGKERLLSLLQELFEKADLGALWNENYNHSNEPCHNLTHYFALLGDTRRTSYWTRRVQKEAYRTGAFGFCGNEDVGQLSAWYVLSALGFAQVCIGDGRYVLNAPLFRSATIRLDPRYHACRVADTFTVRAVGEEELFGACAILNGKPIDRPWLTYEEITNGGEAAIPLTTELP